MGKAKRAGLRKADLEKFVNNRVKVFSAKATTKKVKTTGRRLAVAHSEKYGKGVERRLLPRFLSNRKS